MADRSRVIAPPPLIYLATFVPGWFIDRALEPPALDVLTRMLGGALFFVPGLALAAGAFRAFRRARTTANPYGESTAIITDGPFRYTRNPLYVTLALFYVALALVANAPWAVTTLPIALLLVHHGVILREERYLENRFGDQYVHYKARVRRWV
jgi:protein-S-isoprenylcysteine O-methyltransferase Ste14